MNHHRKDKLSRRRMLRSIGASSGLFASLSGQPKFTKAEPIKDLMSYQELVELAKTQVLESDVRELISSKQYKTIKYGDGQFIGDKEFGLVLFSLDELPDISPEINLNNDDLLVGAARTGYDDGNESYAITYVAGDNTVIHLEEYHEPFEGISRRIRKYEIIGLVPESSRLSLLNHRVNGKPVLASSDVYELSGDTDGTSVFNSMEHEPIDGGGGDGGDDEDPCGGCNPGPGGGGYREGEECVDFDITCGTLVCGTCAWCGLGIHCWVVCMTINCFSGLSLCCNDTEVGCVYCP